MRNESLTVPSGLLLRSVRSSGTSTNRSEWSTQYAARQFWKAERMFSSLSTPPNSISSASSRW